MTCSISPRLSPVFECSYSVFRFRLIATVVRSKRACASVITCTNSTAAWRHTWTTATPLTSFDRQTVDSSLNWEGELIFALGVATLNIFDSKQTEATNLSQCFPSLYSDLVPMLFFELLIVSPGLEPFVKRLKRCQTAANRVRLNRVDSIFMS